MEPKDKQTEHYRMAGIAAKAAADQLRLRAARGQGKSPENAARVVAEAWGEALKKARELDAPVDSGPSADDYLRSAAASLLKLKSLDDFWRSEPGDPQFDRTPPKQDQVCGLQAGSPEHAQSTNQEGPRVAGRQQTGLKARTVRLLLRWLGPVPAAGNHLS